MEEIDKLIKSTEYQNVILKVSKNKKILDNYYDSLLKIAKKNLETSDVKLEYLEELLKNDEKSLIYSFVKMGLIIDNQEEEFSKGEEPSNDEKMVTINSLGKSITFLIDDLIEYYLLKKSQKELENYLKAIRIPNAKKYAQELREVYDSIK